MISEPTLIAGPDALAAFRAGSLSWPSVRRYLTDAGERPVFLGLPPGVGKSHAAINAARGALADGDVDRVVYAAPLHSILNEVANALADLQPVLLRSRPAERCGDLDREWQSYETRGLGILARRELCQNCPHRTGCPWPNQMTRVPNAKLVLLTHARLRADRDLMIRLTTERRTLFIVDEAELIVGPAAGLIPLRSLHVYQQVVESLAGRDESLTELATWTRALRGATTVDLRADWSPPPVPPDQLLRIQTYGDGRFGSQFADLRSELLRFSRSDRLSRVRTPAAVKFAASPLLAEKTLILAATVNTALLEFRLDPGGEQQVHAPLAGYHFSHLGTTWTHISSFEATVGNIPGNLDRILELFAGLTARNIRVGKRTLLMCKKRYLSLFVRVFPERLAELGVDGARVITEDWDTADLTDPMTIPLINYGVKGINLFEDFDAAYCLSSYLVKEEAVAERLTEFDPELPVDSVRFEFAGTPQRRRVKINDPAARYTAVERLADATLEVLETDPILQAVARVRPYTKPRDVVTFQPGPLIGAPVTQTVPNLPAAREAFGLPTRRNREGDARFESFLELLRTSSPAEAARQLGISRATQYRFLRRVGPADLSHESY